MQSPHAARNATRFRFTAFRISSIDISTMTTLRRVSTPITPEHEQSGADHQIMQCGILEPFHALSSLALVRLENQKSELRLTTTHS